MLRLSPTRTIIRGDSDNFRVRFAKKSIVSNTKTHSSCCCLHTNTTNNKVERTPVDISEWKVRFTVRPAVPDSSITDDTDALISVEAQIVDAEEGLAFIYVGSELTEELEPGEYLYDIQVIQPLDEYGHNKVASTRRGKYVVIGDITREVPEIEDIYIGEDGNFIFTDAIVISDEDGNLVIEGLDDILIPNLVEDGDIIGEDGELLITDDILISDTDGNLVFGELADIIVNYGEEDEPITDDDTIIDDNSEVSDDGEGNIYK